MTDNGAEENFTVICIDDTENVRVSDGLLLETMLPGAWIKLAANFDQGMAAVAQAVREGGRMMVQTDYNYGESRNGFDLIAQVHGDYPSVPCIMVTGEPETVREKASAMGVPVFNKTPATEIMNRIQAVKNVEMDGPGSGAYAARMRLTDFRRCTPYGGRASMNGSVYESGPEQGVDRHCFGMLAVNEPGVLARLLGLLAGRGFNVESLTADEIDHENHISRITLVVSGPPMVIDQVKAQLERIIPMRQVVNLKKQGKFVESCMALVKVIAPQARRSEALKIANEYRAWVADETGNAIIFELTSTPERLDEFIDKLRPLGVVEIARTGSAALACGEGFMSVPPVALLRAQG